MPDNFDIEQFIEQYTRNIRKMQLLTDDQIKEVMLYKIEQNPEYFEIISDVSQKVDNKKLIRQVLADTQSSQAANPEPTDVEKFSGRRIA